MRTHDLFANGFPVIHEWTILIANRGRGRCTCGEWSDELESDDERKAWHKAHLTRTFVDSDSSG